MRVFLAGAGSMEEPPPNKIYTEAIANETSLRCLLRAQANANENAWRNALYAIWGSDAIYKKGERTLKKAPPTLRSLYEEIFKIRN